MEIIDNGDEMTSELNLMVILMMVQDLMINIMIAKTIIRSMITALTQGNTGTCAQYLKSKIPSTKANLCGVPRSVLLITLSTVS